MDKCIHEVRKQRWKNIIGQCLQRPEGMTVKQWLDENNICEQTYVNVKPYAYRSSSFKMWKVFSRFDSLYNLASSFTEVERGISSFKVFFGSA